MNRTGDNGCATTALLLALSAAVVAAPAAAPAGAPAAAPDPQLALLLQLEAQSLKDVCGTKCHSIALFAGAPRNLDTWHETVQKMIDRGAEGSDEQLQDIMDYLHRTLTTVNVNEAAPDELVFTLGVNPSVAEAIVARRAQHRFATLAELQAVAGGDAKRLGESASKLRF
jgi:hypothetical protein